MSAICAYHHIFVKQKITLDRRCAIAHSPYEAVEQMRNSSIAESGKVMVENTVKEEIKSKLHIAWGKLVPGGILAVIVSATVVADIWNNAGYAYASMGPGAAVVAGAIGLMVGLAPIIAFFIGWDTALRSAAGCCTIACVLFALFAYGEKNGAQQGAKTMAGMSMVDADTARQEARDARAEASRITEVASVRDLDALQASAKASLDSASAAAKKQGIECIQSKRCRKERAELDQVTERLGQARAKADAIERAEKAEGRLASAKTEAREAGPASANALASIASSWFRLEVRTTEQQFAFVMMLVLIGSTLSIAFLGEHATKLMVEAFHSAEPKRARPATVARKLEVAAEAPVPGKKKSDMDGFLDSWTEASEGPPLQAGEFFKCLVAHWAQHHPGKNVPTTTALGRALGERYAKVKTGGKQCYMAKLRRLGAVRAGLEPASVAE